MFAPLFDKPFLVNTITAWDEPHRARHQLTLALSKNYPVIFVARNKIGKPKIKRIKISDNITLVQPSFPIEYRFRYRIPFVNEIYQIWLFRKLKKTYANANIINFDFTAHLIFKYFKIVVYYCNDEYIGNSKYPNLIVNNYHKFCERRVIRNSILNISTSRYLTQKLSGINPSTFEILLGVTPINLPRDYNGMRKRNGNKIVVGLMGVINERQISVEQINALSFEPSITLIIIGPIEKRFLHKLKSPNTIVMTGVLKEKELFNQLMQIDVGVALYNVRRLNPGCTPNKLWQYLAVGKPVVISDIPNLSKDDFPERSVYIFENKNSLIDLITLAHVQNNVTLAQKRIEFARMNTWDQRAEHFVNIFSNIIHAQ